MFCLLMSTSLVWSQKIGHLNSRTLLDSLKETKDISIELANYEKALSETGEKMVIKFQSNLELYRKEVASGNLTPVKQKQMESELEVEQDAIGKYQQSARESLEKRKTDLLSPLLSKIDKAIDEVALEGAFSMIFDSSVSMLFVDLSFDVSALVLSKLNQSK